jgi:inosine-uridine nucleoside N-ribohydrolase
MTNRYHCSLRPSIPLLLLAVAGLNPSQSRYQVAAHPQAPDAQIAVASESQSPVPVIFDNDVDFDDTAALAYLARLHKAGRVDLRLVTVTYSGVALPARGIRHVRCLLERFDLAHIPVADSEREGRNPFPDQLRFAFEQVLTDVTPGCMASDVPSAVPAEQAIVDSLGQSDRPVTILATGPLTNIAAAFELWESEPSRAPLDSKLHRLYFQGGAFRVAGGLCCGLEATFDGTQTFNVWGEPEAALATIARLRPGRTVFIGADATDHVPIRSDFVARLGAEANTSEAQYVHQLVSHPILAFAISSGLGVFWWDPLAAVAATTQSVVDDSALLRTTIVLSGRSEGRTLELNPWEPGAWIRAGLWADREQFETQFLWGLNIQ